MQHTMKRILSLALAVMMLLSYAPVGVRAEGAAPALPTATIGEAELDKAVFAVNFKADALTDEQLAYYGNWEVDFVLSVNKPLSMNNLKPSEMAYISLLCPAMEGFEIWSDLPGDPENDLVLAANEPWGVINYFAEMMEAVGEEPVVIDLATFSYVSELCGLSYALILQETYLQANPGLVANVSLVLTNPENGQKVTIATHTYTSPYNAPELPGATVTTTPASQLDKDIPLTFAMNFAANEPSAEQGAFYGNWYADFVLTVNADVTLNADGEGDGYLAGEYGEYGWIKAPTEPVTLKAGESLKIMEYAAEMMEEPGLQFTYAEVVESVKSFNCGAYFTPEFLAANPDFEVTLELKLYESKTATEGQTIGETFKFTAEDALAPELPTATVVDTLQSELDEGMELTFAKTFTAIAPSDEQAAYYGKYYADFVLTVNKDVTLNAADENADGYLSGQYDAWSANWMNVPIDEITLKAGEELRIMEYAAELLNQPGLKMTYEEILNEVGTFNCGAYFTPEFLAANPDFKGSVELRLYNPEDESKTYTIGETYEFAAADVPALPTANVEEIENKDLTFAMNFAIEEITAAQMAYYGEWFADFELTINKTVTFDANGGKDGYLSGQYDAWSENWVNVPVKPVTLEAGETIKIMEFAAELLGEPGLKYTYREVYETVKDFDCGVFFEPEFLAANPDLEVTLELRMYNPADETKSYVIGETYTFGIPELPNAIITETENEDLTFSMNFAIEEVTEEQMAYYGKWFADFELTVNKTVTFGTDEGTDGYLSGQYDEWSENWVNVPFGKTVTLEAGETIKIMEFAAELLGEPGLKYTYREVYETVKDFDCGVFFEPEFLAANPDLEVTLELRMYNPADETKSYVIGETYTFGIPELPGAIITETENEDLTFSMNFAIEEVTEEQLAYYGKWFADFELTVNKTVTFGTDEGTDGYLSGQYDEWSENWVNVPFGETVTLEAGETIKIMEFAAELLGEPGLKYTYREVYEIVKDFDCGVFFEPEFLAANPDLKVTLELRMYNPADETVSVGIGEIYEFENEFVAQNTVTKKLYKNAQDALLEAQDGETVILLRDVEEISVAVLYGVKLDLNGHTMTAGYVSCFGDIIDSSEDNTGLLKVRSTRILIQNNNEQLPVMDGEGYRFVDVLKFNQKVKEGPKYVFQPLFEEDAHALLLAGKNVTGVSIMVRVSWTQEQGTRTQDFEYNDSFVQQFINSYNPETGKYDSQLTLTLTGADAVANLTFTAVVRSNTGVEFTSAD